MQSNNQAANDSTLNTPNKQQKRNRKTNKEPSCNGPNSNLTNIVLSTQVLSPQNGEPAEQNVFEPNQNFAQDSNPLAASTNFNCEERAIATSYISMRGRGLFKIQCGLSKFSMMSKIEIDICIEKKFPMQKNLNKK